MNYVVPQVVPIFHQIDAVRALSVVQSQGKALKFCLLHSNVYEIEVTIAWMLITEKNAFISNSAK